MDYCVMCGKEVDPEEWREHMKGHGMVSLDPIKDENGAWIKLDDQSPGITE